MYCGTFFLSITVYRKFQT